MQPDNELLRQYATARSEEAFAELVKRHVNLVYSAALRQTNGDTHLAHDVAQSVFTDLARKAASFSQRKSLTGRLYTSAYFAANKMVRTEVRRREREEKFMREPIHESTQESDWEKLRPLLDSAMHGLKESDREAILLRYFENRPYAEVGAKFGVNENAARLRVERALGKLRHVLAKQGISTASTLGAVVSANAVQVAPAHLAATFATTASATASAGTSTLLHIMTATKLKLIAGALAVASVTTAFVLQHQAQAKLRSENDTLQQQLAQLKKENEDISNSLLNSKNAQTLSQEKLNELLRLRAQVGDLNRQLAEAAKARANLAAAQPNEPSSTNDPATQEHAFRKRTLTAVHHLADATVWRYADRHNGRFPTNWNQVKEDYETSARLGLNPGDVVPDTEADFAWVTNEYEFTYQGSTKDLLALTNGYDMIVVREKQPWLSRDGKWIKTYGFADGTGLLIAEPPEGFAAWESQRLAPSPTNQ